jgi:hypothetical protein
MTLRRLTTHVTATWHSRGHVEFAIRNLRDVELRMCEMTGAIEGFLPPSRAMSPAVDEVCGRYQALFVVGRGAPPPSPFLGPVALRSIPRRCFGQHANSVELRSSNECSTSVAKSPRRITSRTAAARLGMRWLKRKSSIASSSSGASMICKRSARRGFRCIAYDYIQGGFLTFLGG